VSAKLSTLSATDVARMIHAGTITSQQVVEDCLERIVTRDDVVHAWVAFDAARAIEEARARDRVPAEGPLHGVPVGIKDIIDTADMPTQMGSPIYSGNRPAADASCVALLRRAGAVILGKTVTAEFAHVQPGATANPLDPAHTPGGSSSGSAAAVADFMTPLAVGTQTGGSTLRPASFCGVVGYKPTFGRINRAGVKPGAESLDTIGLIARNIEDVELMARVLIGSVSLPRRRETAPRIGLVRTHVWDSALPETVAALEDTAARLKAAGAEVREIRLPDSFENLYGARVLISNYERARVMAYEWDRHRERLSKAMHNAITDGLKIPADEYLKTLQIAQQCRHELPHVFEGLDALLTPSASGEAPKGLGSTGDPRFQDIWTVLHAPALTLPTHRGPNGLPVGIQLVARIYQDELLLTISKWVWRRLGK